MNYRKHLVITIPVQGDLEGWIYVVYTQLGDKITTSTERYATKLRAEVAAQYWLDQHIQSAWNSEQVFSLDNLDTQMKWAR